APIRNDEIEEAVVVIVAPAGAQGLVQGRGDQVAFGHRGERSVPVVVVEKPSSGVAGAVVVRRGWVTAEPGEGVEEAIVVVVAPRKACQPISWRERREDPAGGDMREGGIAVVPEELHAASRPVRVKDKVEAAV